MFFLFVFIGSQQNHYRRIEGGLESELSRVEGNTEKHRRQWEELQGSIRLGVEKQYRERREKFTREQTELIRVFLFRRDNY